MEVAAFTRKVVDPVSVYVLTLRLALSTKFISSFPSVSLNDGVRLRSHRRCRRSGVDRYYAENRAREIFSLSSSCCSCPSEILRIIVYALASLERKEWPFPFMSSTKFPGLHPRNFL